VQLNQAEIIQHNQQQYLVSGAVDFSTVPGLMQQALALFKSGKKPDAQATAAEIKVDLSSITVCNSAGLALILEMARQASHYNLKLLFENLPETLLTIAKAYGIEDEIRDLT